MCPEPEGSLPLGAFALAEPDVAGAVEPAPLGAGEAAGAGAPPHPAASTATDASERVRRNARFEGSTGGRITVAQRSTEDRRLAAFEGCPSASPERNRIPERRFGVSAPRCAARHDFLASCRNPWYRIV